eukprot:scpid28530/ scgid26805/ 
MFSVRWSRSVTLLACGCRQTVARRAMCMQTDRALIAEVLDAASSWQDIASLWNNCAWSPAGLKRVLTDVRSASPTPPPQTGADRWQDEVFSERLRKVLASRASLSDSLSAYKELPWPLCTVAGHSVLAIAVHDAQRTRDGARLAETVRKVYATAYVHSPKLTPTQLDELLSVAQDLHASNALSLIDTISLYHSATLGSTRSVREKSKCFHGFSEQIDALVNGSLEELPILALGQFILAQMHRDVSAIGRRAFDVAFARRREFDASLLISVVCQLCTHGNSDAGRGLHMDRWLERLDEAAAPHLLSLTERKLDQLCRVFFLREYTSRHCAFVEVLRNRRDAVAPALQLIMLNYSVLFLDVPLDVVVHVLRELCDSRRLPALLVSEVQMCARILDQRAVRSHCLDHTPAGEWMRRPETDETSATLLGIADSLLEEIAGRRLDAFPAASSIRLARDLRRYACSSPQAPRFITHLLRMLDNACRRLLDEFSSGVNVHARPGDPAVQFAAGASPDTYYSSQSVNSLLGCFVTLAALSCHHDRLVFDVLGSLLALSRVIAPAHDGGAKARSGDGAVATGDGGGEELSLSASRDLCMALKKLRSRPENWLCSVTAQLTRLNDAGRLLDGDKVESVAKCLHCLTMLDIAIAPAVRSTIATCLLQEHQFVAEHRSAAVRLLWCLTFPGGRTQPLVDRDTIRTIIDRNDLARSKQSDHGLMHDVQQMIAYSPEQQQPNAGIPAVSSSGPVKPTLSRPMAMCLQHIVGSYLLAPSMTQYGFSIDGAFCLDCHGNLVPWQPIVQRQEYGAGSSSPPSRSGNAGPLYTSYAPRSHGGHTQVVNYNSMGSNTMATGAAAATPLQPLALRGDDVMRVAVVGVTAGMRVYQSDRFFGVLRSHVAILEANGWHCLCLRDSRGGDADRMQGYIRTCIQRLHQGRRDWSGYHDYLAMQQQIWGTRSS